jgi:hypothetical protein
MSRLYLIKIRLFWKFMCFLCSTLTANAQVFNVFEAINGRGSVGDGLSINGGYTILLQNKTPQPFHGAHFELGITDTPIFFRVTYLPRQTDEIESGMLTGNAIDINKNSLQI